MEIPKKLVLNGTDNNGFRHRYSFEKNADFRDGFLEFMSSLGFEYKDVRKKFEVNPVMEDDSKVPILLDSAAIADTVWFFKNDSYEVDLFFGEKKVVLLVRTRRRDVMVSSLEKRSDWISEEEKEKRYQERRAELNKLAGGEVSSVEIIRN